MSLSIEYLARLEVGKLLRESCPGGSSASPALQRSVPWAHLPAPAPVVLLQRMR